MPSPYTPAQFTSPIYAIDTYDHNARFSDAIEMFTYQLPCLKKMGKDDARWIPIYNHLTSDDRHDADEKLFFWAVTKRLYELKHSTTFFKTKHVED